MGDSIDDEDFNSRDHNEFSIDDDDDDDRGLLQGRATVVQNQPHDEEVLLSDTASFGGRDDPPNIADHSLIESQSMDELPAGGMPQPSNTRQSDDAGSGQEARPGRLAGVPQDSAASGAQGSDVPGAYNAMEFKHLNVSDDVKTLFQYISRYKPQHIELETKLKPFIPDYIPSVGGVDEFIKVPRPDGKPDLLGLKVLDEPAARQSDPTVLTLQLRTLSKEAPGSQADMIGRIEHTDEAKAKKITGWISSIADIHKSKPPAVVNYAKRMPDLEALMQEWPPEMEAALKSMKLPTGELDLDLKSFSKLVCSLLDIPIYDNPVESLHVLFSLYLEFKNNPVFGQQLQGGGEADMAGTGSAVGYGYESASRGSAATPMLWGDGRSNVSAGSMGIGSMHGGHAQANVMTFQ